MEKNFFSFADGVAIPDFTVNNWIREIQKELGDKVHWSCSCGDTRVDVHVYDSTIQVSVSTAQGYCSVQFYSMAEFKEWSPSFCRNDLRTKQTPSKTFA